MHGLSLCCQENGAGHLERPPGADQILVEGRDSTPCPSVSSGTCSAMVFRTASVTGLNPRVPGRQDQPLDVRQRGQQQLAACERHRRKRHDRAGVAGADGGCERPEGASRLVPREVPEAGEEDATKIPMTPTTHPSMPRRASAPPPATTTTRRTPRLRIASLICALDARTWRNASGASPNGLASTRYNTISLRYRSAASISAASTDAASHRRPREATMSCGVIAGGIQKPKNAPARRALVTA